MQLEKAVLTYVADRQKRREFSRESARTATSILVCFAAVVGPDLPVEQLRESHVVTWMDAPTAKRSRDGRTRRKASSTIRTQLAYIRTFCRWLVQRKHLRSDPTAAIAGPRKTRTLPRSLPKDSVSAVFPVLPDSRAELVVLLMLQEGLRAGEVAGAQLGGIDWRGQTISVVGKGGHERMLPLSDETMEALRRYLDEHPGVRSGPLIRSLSDEMRGVTASRLSHQVADWCWAAGIKERPYDGVSGHAFRHTMAVDMLEEGATLPEVQAALGHQSLSSTGVYVRAHAAALRRAMGGRSYRTT